MHGAAHRFSAKLHARQAVVPNALCLRVKADAIIMHFDHSMAMRNREQDFDLRRLGIIANVGQRLLHKPVHPQHVCCNSSKSAEDRCIGTPRPSEPTSRRLTSWPS